MHAHVGFLAGGEIHIKYPDGCVVEHKAPQIVAVEPVTNHVEQPASVCVRGRANYPEPTLAAAGCMWTMFVRRRQVHPAVRQRPADALL